MESNISGLLKTGFWVVKGKLSCLMGLDLQGLLKRIKLSVKGDSIMIPMSIMKEILIICRETAREFILIKNEDLSIKESGRMISSMV